MRPTRTDYIRKGLERFDFLRAGYMAMRGVTPEELAQKTGISRATIYRRIRTKDWTLKEVLCISYCLGFSEGELAEVIPLKTRAG